MKVAFATDDGRFINSHFGHCNTFSIYEITPEKFEWSETRQVQDAGEENEFGKIDARVNAILDCPILFITQIGATAAAKVTRNKIMPIKVEDGTSILEQLVRLQKMLQTRPPIWLAKHMQQNQGKEEIREY